MKVLFLTAELAPYVSFGGLSQVMYFLPKELRKMGHDIRVFTPKYGAMDETAPPGGWKLKTVLNKLAVPVDEQSKRSKKIICNVKSFVEPESDVTAYFLENREYYELRANVFGYRDDHIRFALLSKACLEWLSQMRELDDDSWWPDVIHCHDWHTGYFIDMARKIPRYAELFKNTPIILTVHNFAYQGNFDFRYASKEEYDYGKTPPASLLSYELQTQNAMKRGLLYADAINTVSPTHAVEVLTSEYANGLEDVLQEVRGKLTGILNGLDTESFNPETDKKIKKQFSETSFATGRKENKKVLQKRFRLPVDENRPLLAYSGRLAKQKGLDLLCEILPQLLVERPEVQIIFLGSGEERYRLELSVLQKNFPSQVGLYLRTDFTLPRQIFAGADMILMPSVYEPGGIVALEALRYGSVPVVRRTGGLNDIVTDFDLASKQGNGFSFKDHTTWALYGKIVEALTVYKSPKLWKSLVTNCLSSDFSWEHAAREYESWYAQLYESINKGKSLLYTNERHLNKN